MADMRPRPLLHFRHRRILMARCCVGRMSSQSRRCSSMFPSGRCCRPPRRYTDQPGPFVGPGFFWQIRTSLQVGATKPCNLDGAAIRSPRRSHENVTGPARELADSCNLMNWNLCEIGTTLRRTIFAWNQSLSDVQNSHSGAILRRRVRMNGSFRIRSAILRSSSTTGAPIGVRALGDLR